MWSQLAADNGGGVSRIVMVEWGNICSDTFCVDPTETQLDMQMIVFPTGVNCGAPPCTRTGTGNLVSYDSVLSQNGLLDAKGLDDKDPAMVRRRLPCWSGIHAGLWRAIGLRL